MFDYTKGREAAAKWLAAEATITQQEVIAEENLILTIDAVRAAGAAGETLRSIERGLNVGKSDVARLRNTGRALTKHGTVPTGDTVRSLHTAIRTYVDGNGEPAFTLLLAESKSMKGLISALRKPKAKGEKAPAKAETLVKSAFNSAAKALDAEVDDWDLFQSSLSDLERAIAALKALQQPKK